MEGIAEETGIAPANAQAWEDARGGDCGRHVIRGGAWGGAPRDVRSADRGWDPTGAWFNLGLGFRLAQDLDD